MKKLAIVGKGTIGCLAINYFLQRTDWHIDWIFDSSIPTTSVGEGTTLAVAKLLQTFDWTNNAMSEFNAVPKLGIYKKNWTEETFSHSFPFGEFGIHMSAVDLQNKIYDFVKTSPRINIINMYVENPNDLDADHVMICSGSPKDYSDYTPLDHVSVDSCFVTQCYWDRPEFMETLTIARPYGWVFGIPIQNRCSIGYLYNSNYTSLSNIKKDVQSVFEDFGLTPSDTTNHIQFKSYYKNNNFSNKVVYNGNASFFVEPLEATTSASAIKIMNTALNLWHGVFPSEFAQNLYENEINAVESIICMHYMSGSTFKNDFWNDAKKRSTQKLQKDFKEGSEFSNIVKLVTKENIDHMEMMNIELGTWEAQSYKFNIERLGIKDTLIEMAKNNS